MVPDYFLLNLENIENIIVFKVISTENYSNLPQITRHHKAFDIFMMKKKYEFCLVGDHKSFFISM